LSPATCCHFFSLEKFSPVVMSTSKVSFLVRIDKAISSYFEDKPTLWSYDSFLKKLKPLIMEDEGAELPSVWRKRFLTALKEIPDDDTKDEQVRYIANLLSKQLGDIISPKTVYGVCVAQNPGGCRPLFLQTVLWGCRSSLDSWDVKLTATNASFWKKLKMKKLKMEKNRKSSEAKLHHKKSKFILNSQIEALGVLELARTLQTIQATNELGQYINKIVTIPTMNILEIVNPAKCYEQEDDESTKPDEGTIATTLTQDEDQRLLLKKHQLEIEELELPKSKKIEAVTDFAQGEDRRLVLRERRLSIEERENFPEQIDKSTLLHMMSSQVCLMPAMCKCTAYTHAS
ncbi:19759_t:CDS:10, partial [Funneliformis geosporum]